MKKFALIILFISCNANALVWMEKQKEFDKFGRQYASVFVTETIDENDVKEFKKVLDSVKKEDLHIKYDSIILKRNLGGSVWSAMEIGAMIRKNNLSTWIPKDEYCMSACVHILVAGVCRMAEGDIYIHRRIHVTKEEKERTRKETLALRKWESEYFKLMDVDPILEWKIHGNPHWNGRFLSETEKLDLGFYGAIEDIEENRLNYVANNIGVNKSDLMNELSKKYDSMNHTPNFIERFLSVLFPYKFRDIFRGKYPSCTEQLFLDK
jgi:hypothetical protein